MRLFLSTLFVCITLQLFAQNKDSVGFEEVVILEERMPLKISETGRQVVIIKAEEIKKMNAVSLNEVLSYVNGVDLRQRGPLGVQADVGLRGGSFDQTLILINGMKVSDPQTGHHALNLPIPLENIEQIEVVKGPAARLYGPNAYNGAINIVTKPGIEKTIALSAFYGQKNLHGLNATINIPSKIIKQSLSVSASGSDSFIYNTDFAIKNVLYQAQLDKKGWKIDLLAAANDKKFGANSFYASKNYRDQYEETQTYFSGLTLAKNITENLKINARLYGRRHEDHYLLFRENPSIYENIHTTHVWAAEVAGQTNWGKVGINFGIDTRKEQIESTNLGSHKRNIYSAFIDAKYPLGKFLINPGMNVTSISGFKPQVFPGIDLSYGFTKSSRLFANWGTAFRIPTFTDLYYIGPENIGNDNLTPESAVNYEVGYKYQKNKIQASTSVFYRHAENAIEWVRTSEENPWQPKNFQIVNTLGFEANGTYRINKGYIRSISLAYTYLNIDFDVADGLLSKYQLESLRQQAIMRLEHKIWKNIYHSISLRWLDRYHFKKTYTVFDAKLFYQKDRLQCFAEATNLLNSSYNETNLVQMPGRWIRFGLGYTFGY